MAKGTEPRKKRVSIKDIALAAQASPSAVSFVLSGQQRIYRISNELAERIRRTAQELNYTPNGFARSLRKGTNHTIGVIVSDISNPFFADLVRNIEITAEGYGYMALFASSDEDASKTSLLVEEMLGKGVDGMILVPCDGSKPTIRLLEEKGVPFVLLDRYFPDLKTNYVALDNFHAGYNVTAHLIRQGYRKIAMVSYDTDLINIKAREDGYRQALNDADAGDPGIVHAVKMTDSLESGCRKAMQGILHSGADAILFATNSLTVQCLHFIKDNNIKIPDDLGLAGFDGGSVFDFFYAPLTYVDQPLEKMARKSVEVLIEVMESGQGMTQNIEMEATLVPRISSAEKKTFTNCHQSDSPGAQE